MTLQQAREVQHTINIATTGLSGSRRRNGNTKFLLEKAYEAASRYFGEINVGLASSGLRLRLELHPRIFETHFDDMDEMIESVTASQALLLASPVYFGSISPTLNELLREISDRSDIDLTRKTADSVVVGTQRNGGQETAIEDLWRWYIDRNITFSGNGPVTSQYGGTAWGGARMSAKRDVYGISTTEGAGKTLVQDTVLRSLGEEVLGTLVGQKANFFSSAEGLELERVEAEKYIPSCRFLFFADGATPTPKALEMMTGIEKASKEFEEISGIGERVRAHTDFLSLETDMKNVKDCAACAICPPGNQKVPGVYGCIYDDDLNRNFERFYRASAIICSTQDRYGLTPPKYWKTLNRMRSVRRNDYMFTGRMGSVVYQSTPGSQIPLKWLIRNNMPILASSRENSFELGKLLFRETILRQVGQNFFRLNGVNVWTPPTHHE